MPVHPVLQLTVRHVVLNLTRGKLELNYFIGFFLSYGFVNLFWVGGSSLFFNLTQ